MGPDPDDALREAAHEAAADAERAAGNAGVVVAELDDIGRIEAGVGLLTRVWDNPPDRPVIEANTVRALALSGNQVLGAYEGSGAGDPERLVGVSIAWLGRHEGGEHLHSHITGVALGVQGHDVGFAIKLAQRAWALARGLDEIRWTFDPLVRRNAWFNLTKLGALADKFFPNLYGAMTDAVNADDETDRLEVCWRLTDPRVRAAAAHEAPEPDLAALREAGAVVVLDEGPGDEPVVDYERGEVLLAWAPPDVLQVRAHQPGLARAWRLAARDAIGGALLDGFEAVAMSRSGWYVLRRPAAGRADSDRGGRA